MHGDAVNIQLGASFFLAAFLALPAHSLAQSSTGLFGGRAPKPVCAYEGVMSDAEIELCTGHRVHYNYAIYPGRSVGVARAGGSVQQATTSNRVSRPTKKRRQP